MENLNTLMELPVKLMELSTENLKKSAEITLNYFQNLEKNQREFIKSSYDLFNTTLPGENKLWETQNNMIEKYFEMTDKAYSSISGIINRK